MNAAEQYPARMFPSSVKTRGVTAAPDGGEETAMLVLDGRGVISDCDRAGESLFGYACTELIGRHVAVLIPELAGQQFILRGQLNQRLRYRSRIGHPFRVVPRGRESFPGILFLNCLDNPGGVRLSLIVRRASGSAGHSGIHT